MKIAISKPSKKKQIAKVSSSSSGEILIKPKTRRKSSDSGLSKSNISKKSLDFNKKNSVNSVKIAKKSKEPKVSENVDSVLTASHSYNEVNSLENLSSRRTPKKAVKRRLSVSNSSFTARKEEDRSESTLESRKVKFQDFEQKFNVKYIDVENAVNGVVKFASENPHLQNKLFNDEIPLFLQINSFKIPKTKGPIKQLFRIPMKHSILPSDAEICLIVPDVKGIRNNEHDKHLEHYENLLRSKDVTGVKKIMTFHEFRTEYDTFELKHRLVDLYDVFLVDGKISGKVVHKCGSIFYKKRKVPTAIKLHLPKLKSHIDKAVKKAYFHLNVRSDSHIVQIGHSNDNVSDLVENVYSVIEFLDKQFPGKMGNIRSLNVYAHRGSSIPIYVSLKSPNEIPVPALKSKKPKHYKSYSGELTTQYNAEVLVRPSGNISVKRRKIS